MNKIYGFSNGLLQYDGTESWYNQEPLTVPLHVLLKRRNYAIAALRTKQS